MGMFDSVKYKAPCWKCGFEMTGWQSKSGDCALESLSVKEVNNFYDICPKCHAWNEYDVIPKEVEIIFNEKKSKLNTN
jgi:Zn finger protein HypA/HybF involved in hydrogenase expression